MGVPPKVEKGLLYIVSAPIGNLADITYRAVQKLEEVSLIAAEDTRRSRILLNHYGIKTPLSSYNSYNKFKKGREFISLLKQGRDIALISDSGTPGISDPLYHLAQLAVEEEIILNPLPGPVAAIAALTVSGLPMDRFAFEGFLPRKKGRKKRLEILARQDRTLVLYESPNRVNKTLHDLLEAMGDRKIAIARELTKMHEEVVRGSLAELVSSVGTRNWRGEVTLVVAGPGRQK
ncbi:MAG: 16S rRNA (cytidine(1402)-2'-O)-methyltransferase [Nitrospinales bacterium]